MGLLVNKAGDLAEAFGRLAPPAKAFRGMLVVELEGLGLARGP